MSSTGSKRSRKRLGRKPSAKKRGKLAQAPTPTKAIEHGDDPQGFAPDGPGVNPTWATGQKSGVGCALSPASNVWFTLANGIVTEIYHPDPSQAAVRDIELIVTDGNSYCAAEKTDTIHEIKQFERGVPGYRVVNTCKLKRFRIEKEIFIDPRQDVLLQRIRFIPLQGAISDFRLYATLAPRLADRGSGNNAWAARYKGRPLLFARRAGHVLAWGASCGWARRTVGFAGTSDAFSDLKQNKRLTAQYAHAEEGNVVLAGEIDLSACGGDFVLVTSFNFDPDAAALSALISLDDDHDAMRLAYIEAWRQWQKQLMPFDRNVRSSERKNNTTRYRSSTMVLRVHRTPRFGSAVASLAVPWGAHRGDDETGGYHLVWTRDMVESASGLLAAGAHEEVTRTLQNLRAVQEADGHWPQDMWVNGCPHARGIQLDEVALPVLLLDLANRRGVIAKPELISYWPMVRAAAGYIARNGPVTQEDRWENTAGYSPFTLAVEIPALLLAAELADQFDKPICGQYLRDLADEWNGQIERWTYASNTELARKLKIGGYYVRIASPDRPINDDPQAAGVVSPDALALVRYGLRDANDPRIINTLRAIDAMTRVQTPFGPSWHRYNGDHYGEHDNGSAPIHGRTEGHGRAWPLLTGERGHYEIAAGNLRSAGELLKAMGKFANSSGFIPEQVWDTNDLPQRGLFVGRPSGSAMPLAWAHAEYLRLLRSIKDRKIFDLPPLVAGRYVRRRASNRLTSWRFNRQAASINAGNRLRIAVLQPAVIRFSTDGWVTFADLPTRDTNLGIHFADMPTHRLKAGDTVTFTFRWLPEGRWEGRDFTVGVLPGSARIKGEG